MATGRLTCQPDCPAHLMQVGGIMTDQNKQRSERLAAALRENLRRRKAQARGLAECPEDDRQRDGNRDENSD